MVDQPIMKKKVPPKPPAKQERKKKGPSKPQPAWLFPQDRENPVLNPTGKSHDEAEKAIKEREKAMDYMKRRVHGVPDRPAPDPLLLTLIGVFLTDFGFNSTSRLFTNERQARKTLNGWEEALGKKIDKQTPKLEQIFREWHRDWLIKQNNETSSDASSDAESEVGVQLGHGAQDSQKEGSSSTSAGSDVEMKDASQPKKVKKTSKIKKISPASASVSSSTSDSDADDEKEGSAPKKTGRRTTTDQQPSGDTVSKLKRKAQNGLADSGLGNLEDERPVKVKKVKTETVVGAHPRPAKGSKAANKKTQITLPASKKPAKSSAGSAPEFSSNENAAAVSAVTSSKKAKAASPSTSESDTSDSNDALPIKSQQGAILPALQTTTSDSSATIHGDSKEPSANASPPSDSSSSATSSSSSRSDAAAFPKTTAAPTTNTTATTTTVVKKKKHKGTKPTPLAEASESASAEAHPSNKYQSYNYADRAYKDLSVTRGKGFTKEKNKKKRGSYRGGAIDTSGGKSYKFED